MAINTLLKCANGYYIKHNLPHMVPNPTGPNSDEPSPTVLVPTPSYYFLIPSPSTTITTNNTPVPDADSFYNCTNTFITTDSTTGRPNMLKDPTLI